VAIENPTRIDEQFAREYRALISDQDFLKFTQLGTTDTATLQDRYKLARRVSSDKKMPHSQHFGPGRFR